MTPIKAILVVAALFAVFVIGGWQSVSEYREQEKTRQELKWAARDTMRLEDRVNELDARVKALEAR